MYFTKKIMMTRAWALAKKGAKKFGGNVREYFAIALKEQYAIQHIVEENKIYIDECNTSLKILLNYETFRRFDITRFKSLISAKNFDYISKEYTLIFLGSVEEKEKTSAIICEHIEYFNKTNKLKKFTSSETEQNREYAKKFGGKSLKNGTAKQKIFAESLRYKVLSSLQASTNILLCTIDFCKNSNFWIENKDLTAREFETKIIRAKEILDIYHTDKTLLTSEIIQEYNALFN